MNDLEREQEIRAALRPIALVVLALTMGVAAFAGILLVLQMRGVLSAPVSAAGDALSLALSIMAVATVIAVFVIRAAILRRLKELWRAQPIDDDPTLDFAVHYSKLTLISAAFIEALALFGLVTFLVSRAWLGLAVAAVCAVALAASLPTANRLRRFTATITGRSWA